MTDINRQHKVKSHLLTAEEYKENFADIHPPLNAREAIIQSERCFYCYDAPCIEACPTGIDIPSFIRKIATENPDGAATTILNANIFGGTCARVCPVDTLCEGACVREASEGKPVKIGLLQRFATDHYFASGEYPFTRAKDTQFKIAIIGAGVAGLAAAHRLSQFGHHITIFEAHDKPGGLNVDGLAAYKVSNQFVTDEINFILKIGGITIEYNQRLGRDFSLQSLRSKFNAVFIACGLGAAKQLQIEGEGLDGVMNAVDYIADLRSNADLSNMPVGKHIIVIGGGNTAIDIASQTKRLGAKDVAMLYRGSIEQLKATPFEQTVVKNDGVRILTHIIPKRIIGNDAGEVIAIECEKTIEKDNKLQGTGKLFTMPADMVFKAIGQTIPDQLLGNIFQDLTLKNGRIAVDEQRSTSIAGIFAGGDCVTGGNDLTVNAVQDGKVAAEHIHRYLSSGSKA